MHIAWPLALDMALGFCSNSAGIVIVLEKVSLPVDGLKHRLAELHVPHWVHLDLTKCDSNQHAFVSREQL